MMTSAKACILMQEHLLELRNETVKPIGFYGVMVGSVKLNPNFLHKALKGNAETLDLHLFSLEFYCKVRWHLINMNDVIIRHERG